MRRNYLIIAIACLIVAVLASRGFSFENMFFHTDPVTLERNEPIITMEDYNFCTAWTEAIDPICTEEGCTEAIESECLEWMIPKPMRLKSSEDNFVYREAYVIQSVEQEEYFHCLSETYDGEDDEGNYIALIEPQCTSQEVRYRDLIVPVELRNVVKVGEYAGKDIIHVASRNQALKAAPSYLGGSYESLIDVPIHGQGISDAVLEVVQELDEEDPETGQMRKVRKRLKTQKWKDRGRPAVKISGGNKPHKWAGID